MSVQVYVQVYRAEGQGLQQTEGGSYTEIGCWGDANQIVLINSTEKSEKKFSLEIPFIIIPVYISNIRR